MRWMGRPNYASRNDPLKAGSDSALHIAAERGDIEVIKLLLEHGARKDLKDSLSRTPHDRAKIAGRIETLKFLEH
jgi:ankyrin repeat protein